MLIVLSLDHRRTTVAERERFMLPAEELQRLARRVRLGCGGQVAFLTTCNRVEVITEIAAEHPVEALARLESMVHRMVPDVGAAFLGHATRFTGLGAARHLFRVGAGLESQIRGDEQILGQVRAAYTAAIDAGTVGPELHRLFQFALRSAKRVHAETAFGHRSASIGAVAAAQAAHWIAQPQGTRAAFSTGAPRLVVLGAGATAGRAAHALVARGIAVTISNRHRERADALGFRTGASVVDFDDRYVAIASADAVIVTTAAPAPTVTATALAEARGAAGRGSTALLVIDLSVPRNVETEIAQIEGVTLLGLQEVTGGSQEERVDRQLHAAGSIIEDELSALQAWFEARATRGRVA